MYKIERKNMIYRSYMCFNTTTCKNPFQKEKKPTTTCTGPPGKRGWGVLIIFFTLSKHMYLQNRAFKIYYDGYRERVLNNFL